MATASSAQEYDVTESYRAPDLNLPQKMGRMLWAIGFGFAVAI